MSDWKNNRSLNWENPWGSGYELDKATLVAHFADGRCAPEAFRASLENEFEAGADAMLEAIKSRGFITGESLRNVKGAIGWANIDTDSKWYPIPEESK